MATFSPDLPWPLGSDTALDSLSFQSFFIAQPHGFQKNIEKEPTNSEARKPTFKSALHIQAV